MRKVEFEQGDTCLLGLHQLKPVVVLGLGGEGRAVSCRGWVMIRWCESIIDIKIFGALCFADPSQGLLMLCPTPQHQLSRWHLIQYISICKMKLEFRRKQFNSFFSCVGILNFGDRPVKKCIRHFLAGRGSLLKGRLVTSCTRGGREWVKMMAASQSYSSAHSGWVIIIYDCIVWFCGRGVCHFWLKSLQSYCAVNILKQISVYLRLALG